MHPHLLSTVHEVRMVLYLLPLKKGTAGPTRVEGNASVGIGNVLRRVDIMLLASQYRAAIDKFDAPNTEAPVLMLVHSMKYFLIKMHSHKTTQLR